MTALFWCGTGVAVVAGVVALVRVRRRLELDAEADRAFWFRYHELEDSKR